VEAASAGVIGEAVGHEDEQRAVSQPKTMRVQLVLVPHC
jgi:hypothetical protein